jgi:hypothetical protein
MNGRNRPDQGVVKFTVLVNNAMPLRLNGGPGDVGMLALCLFGDLSGSFTDDFNLSLNG